MKLIVIHGEHTKDSYKRLVKLLDTGRARGYEIIELDPGSGSVAESVSAGSLFGGKQLFIIKNIKTLGKRDVGLIKKHVATTPGILILYVKGALSRTDQNILGKPDKVEEYRLSENIFAFLDSFFPGNQRNAAKLLHTLTEREPVEFIFNLLGKTLRDLYWVTVDGKTLPYPSWRQQKLSRQAKKFPAGAIENLIDNFAEIDIAAKTSKADLLNSLDLLIASKL